MAEVEGGMDSRLRGNDGGVGVTKGRGFAVFGGYGAVWRRGRLAVVVAGAAANGAASCWYWAKR